MTDFPRLKDWAVRFPRQPNNATIEGYHYEYVKLYGAQCDTCGTYLAAPTRKEMQTIMRHHREMTHGRPAIVRHYEPPPTALEVPENPPF